MRYQVKHEYSIRKVLLSDSAACGHADFGKRGWRMDSKDTALQAETTQEDAQKEEYILRNHWEDKVIERSRAMIDKMDMCTCDKCLYDVAALVLNKLPPQYVTTHKGNLMMKIPSTSAKTELELTVLISRSAMMVKEKPMH